MRMDKLFLMAILAINLLVFHVAICMIHMPPYWPKLMAVLSGFILFNMVIYITCHLISDLWSR